MHRHVLLLMEQGVGEVAGTGSVSQGCQDLVHRVPNHPSPSLIMDTEASRHRFQSPNKLKEGLQEERVIMYFQKTFLEMPSRLSLRCYWATNPSLPIVIFIPGESEGFGMRVESINSHHLLQKRIGYIFMWKFQKSVCIKVHIEKYHLVFKSKGVLM